MRPYSSKLILIPGFAFIILILIVLSVAWAINVTENQQILDDIFGEQTEALQIVNMLQSAQQRAILLHRMAIMEDEFERDEEYLEFMQKAEVFIKARERFIAVENQDGVELNIWDQAKPHIRKGSEVQARTAALILQENFDDANVLLLNEVIPTQNKVMSHLTNMLDVQRQKMQNEINLASVRNNKMFLLVIILGSAAIGLAMTVAFTSVRRTSRVEHSLHQARISAQTATDQKSKFLANMSHEIRTPMTAVLGFAETLLDKDLSEEHRVANVKSIMRNGDHLLHILNDILDLSKIEAKQLDIEKLAVNPIYLVQDVESLMASRAREKGLDFEVKYHFPLPVEIQTDPTRLKQILLNLCGNAIKFTDNGRISLEVSLDTHSKRINFTVADTGIGMNKDEQQVLFKSFSQADVSTTRKYGGTGLGLCISKQLAELLSGDIRCDSLKGVGSSFLVSLDGDINEQTQLLQQMPDMTASVLQENKSTVPKLCGEILLAEDSKDNQVLVSMHIRKTGASVKLVNNGKQAVEQALANDFDLILMDMQMPIMDGIGALRMLRLAGNRTPVVMLTANAMKEDKENCIKHGANGFLTKPLIITEFYAVLAEHLYTSANQSAPKFTSEFDEDFDELITLFIEEMPVRIDKLHDAANHGKWLELGEEVHKLKGIGGGFGFPAITELCAQIEIKLTESDYSGVKKLLNNLSNYTNQIIQNKACA